MTSRGRSFPCIAAAPNIAIAILVAASILPAVALALDAIRVGDEIALRDGNREIRRVSLPPQRLDEETDCISPVEDSATFVAGILIVARGMGGCGDWPSRTALEVHLGDGSVHSHCGEAGDRYLGRWSESPDRSWAIDAYSVDGSTGFRILRSDSRIEDVDVPDRFCSWGGWVPAVGWTAEGVFVLTEPRWAAGCGGALLVDRTGDWTVVPRAPRRVRSGEPARFSSRRTEQSATSRDLSLIGASIRIGIAEARRKFGEASLRVEAGGTSYLDPTSDLLADPAARNTACRRLSEASIRAGLTLPPDASWNDDDDASIDSTVPPWTAAGIDVIVFAPGYDDPANAAVVGVSIWHGSSHLILRLRYESRKGHWELIDTKTSEADVVV